MVLRSSLFLTLTVSCSCIFVHYSSKFREAAQPFLGASVQTSLHACERRCSTVKTCLYGTFFDDSKACMISAKRGKLAACKHCYSFARIVSKYGRFKNDGRVPKKFRADVTPAPTPYPLIMKLDDDDGDGPGKPSKKKKPSVVALSDAGAAVRSGELVDQAPLAPIDMFSPPKPVMAELKADFPQGKFGDGGAGGSAGGHGDVDSGKEFYDRLCCGDMPETQHNH